MDQSMPQPPIPPPPVPPKSLLLLQSAPIQALRQGNWPKFFSETQDLVPYMMVLVSLLIIVSALGFSLGRKHALNQLTSSDWKSYISQGNQFTVQFDATTGKFDDTYYTGDYRTDPLGTLKGGESYTVTYYPQSDNWYVYGFNQGSNTYSSSTYSGGYPQNHQINMWGTIMNFNDQGEVYDNTYGLVGHLLKEAIYPEPRSMPMMKYPPPAPMGY